MTTRSRATMARKPRAVRAQTTGGTALNTGEPPEASTTRRAKVSSVHDPGPTAPGSPEAIRDDDAAAEEYSPSLQRAAYLMLPTSSGPRRGTLCAPCTLERAVPTVGTCPTGPARGGEYPQRRCRHHEVPWPPAPSVVQQVRRRERPPVLTTASFRRLAVWTSLSGSRSPRSWP